MLHVCCCVSSHCGEHEKAAVLLISPAAGPPSPSPLSTSLVLSSCTRVRVCLSAFSGCVRPRVLALLSSSFSRYVGLLVLNVAPSSHGQRTAVPVRGRAGGDAAAPPPPHLPLFPRFLSSLRVASVCVCVCVRLAMSSAASLFGASPPTPHGSLPYQASPYTPQPLTPFAFLTPRRRRRPPHSQHAFLPSAFFSFSSRSLIPGQTNKKR